MENTLIENKKGPGRPKKKITEDVATAEPVKQLYHVHEQAIGAEISRMRDIMPRLQKAINLFDSLNIGSINNISDLRNLMYNPGKFCDNVIEETIPKNATVAGLRLDRTKLIELSTPENMEDIIKLISNMYDLASTVDWDIYKIEKGNIALADDATEMVNEKWSTYIENKAQRDFISFIERIHSLSDEAEKYKNFIGHLNISCDAFTPHWHTGKPHIPQDVINKVIQKLK